MAENQGERNQKDKFGGESRKKAEKFGGDGGAVGNKTVAISNIAASVGATVGFY